MLFRSLQCKVHSDMSSTSVHVKQGTYCKLPKLLLLLLVAGLRIRARYIVAGLRIRIRARYIVAGLRLRIRARCIVAGLRIRIRARYILGLGLGTF